MNACEALPRHGRIPRDLVCSLWYFGWNHNLAPLFLGLFVMLQVGRLWVIRTLGERWTTRIIIVPSAAPVTSGPFRFVRHPNYLIVAAELPCVSPPLVWDGTRCCSVHSISPCWPGAFAPKTQRSSQPNASFYRAAFSTAARFASVNASRFA